MVTGRKTTRGGNPSKLEKEVDCVMKVKNLTFGDAINRQIWRKETEINNQWANGKLTEVLKQKGYHEEFQK